MKFFKKLWEIMILILAYLAGVMVFIFVSLDSLFFALKVVIKGETNEKTNKRNNDVSNMERRNINVN